MSYPVSGYPHLATTRPQGTAADLGKGDVDVRDVSSSLLGELEAYAASIGKTVDIFSGYRTDAYSAQVGGFAGDPHTQGVAVDATVGGKPLGTLPGLSSYGLVSGNQPNFYKGKPDPSHVQLSTSAQRQPAGRNATDVPAPLETAIQSSASHYAVPKDLLEGIWRIESGSTYPNPHVNSSGYGGLFGTTHWNTSTQDQADTAAQILATGLARYGGNVSQALSYYNSGKPVGGYTTVPGETTFGVLPRKDQWLQGAIDQAQNSGIPGAVGSAVGAVGSAAGSVVDAIDAVPKALKFLFSYRFLEILGGGLLLLLGLYLLSRQLGVSVPKVGPVGKAAGAIGA